MPSIPPASFEIGLNGDTIMYYQNRQYNFDAIDGRIDMYASIFPQIQLYGSLLILN